MGGADALAGTTSKPSQSQRYAQSSLVRRKVSARPRPP